MLRFIKFLCNRTAVFISSLPRTIGGLPREIPRTASFLFKADMLSPGFFRRLHLLARFYLITLAVDSLHKQSEVLEVADAILSMPSDAKGCVVEAGSYKGASAAKLSLVCRMTKRELVVFDSFQGLPEDREFTSEKDPRFCKGALRGTLKEVKGNVERFGCIDACRFIKGWFSHSMPGFDEDISLIYLDVDLASSTKACLRFLYPRLEENGALFSHDGHFASVAKVFEDEDFWNEIGEKKPHITGLGRQKLIKAIKTKRP